MTNLWMRWMAAAITLFVYGLFFLIMHCRKVEAFFNAITAPENTCDYKKMVLFITSTFVIVYLLLLFGDKKKRG